MTEIELFQSFRAGVAEPSSSVRAEARARLLADARGLVREPRSRAPFRAGLALAAGVAIVAGAFLVAGFLDGSPGVIDRAEAAIDPQGRVLHVVARVVQAAGAVSVGESWVRPDGTGRTVSRSGGGPGDCLANENDLRCYDASRNVVDVYRYNPEAVAAGKRYAELPGYRVDQPESIHRAFGAGYARLVGEATIAGRPVWEIELAVPWIDRSGKATPRFEESASPRLYLDHASYLPVAERFPD